MQMVDFHPKVFLAYSEVADGNIDARFSPPPTVKANRKTLFKALGLNPYQIIEGQQVHENRVLPLDAENIKMWHGQNVTGVDGFITNQTDIYLMLRLADCLPLVLIDPVKNAIGVVHVGWRGAVGHIHLKALELLTKKYGTDPHDVLAWFGPSALECHYVSPESPSQLEDNPGWKPFVKNSDKGYKVDIVGYVSSTFKDAGLLKKNQHFSNMCTIETPTLFSHQRSQSDKTEEGRFALIASLKS